jgi:regulatory protein
MRKVTALREGKGREKRVKLYLDGQPALNLQAEVAAREGLEVGQELSAGELEELARADRVFRCLTAAYRYLGYRPRSESEVKTRLKQRGFESDVVDVVLTRLKEQGLVDDAAFAQFWRENREAFSPRSRWLTGRELRQKGIESEVIDQAVGDLDESDGAYRAALAKAGHWPLLDYQSFRRRLGDYLRRRGFGYGVIVRTVERIWQERDSGSG